MVADSGIAHDRATKAAKASPRDESSRQASFDEFYSSAAPRITGQVFAMTGDLAEAQDCVQEAFARAWLRWDSVAVHPKPAGWVRTTAWRLAVSRFRRAKLALGIARRDRPPEPTPGPGPDSLVLAEALAKLPVEQRRVIVLHYLVDMKVDEIAAEIGAPSGTVKARLSRGRAALSQLLDDGEEAGDA